MRTPIRCARPAVFYSSQVRVFRLKLMTWLTQPILFIVLLLMHPNCFAVYAPVINHLCADSRLYCVRVPHGQSWSRMFPDPTLRDTVMRINHMNTRLIPGMLLAIPNDKSNTNFMAYAPFASHIAASGTRTIIFDPKLTAWAAYDVSGNLVYWGPGSGGKSWCSDIRRSCRTVVGVFRMYEKRGRDCFSTKFPMPNGGAPMPYCMFFKGGFAMHASNTVPGYNDSHGCIRIFFEDAQWLNQHFVTIHATRVIVLPYGAQTNKKYTTVKTQDQLDDDEQDDTTYYTEDEDMDEE